MAVQEVMNTCDGSSNGVTILWPKECPTVVPMHFPDKVSRWDAYEGVWLGEVEPPVDYGRPVRVFVKRRLKDGAFVHSYYVSTLSLPSKGLFMAQYDGRGGAEVEQFRNDKSGLSLEARRKRSFLGQKGYILLTDLAHNLLTDFYFRALAGTQFDGFGPQADRT